MKSILKGVIAQKSKEELNALKEKDEKQNKEHAELNDEELTQVSGGEFTLDIAGAKKKEDTQVFLHEQNGTTAQKWILEEDESGNVYVKSK